MKGQVFIMLNGLMSDKNRALLNICWDKFEDNEIRSFIRHDVKPGSDLLSRVPLKLSFGAEGADGPRPSPNIFNHMLGDDLMIYHDRPIRLPLPAWSSYILDQLDKDRAADETLSLTYAQVSTYYNQAALIELNYGRMENALRLCLAHLQWLSLVVNETGQLELSELALQPWINLGRLDRFTGKPEASLEKFALLLKGKTKEELDLGRLTITARHWEAIARQNPNLYSFIETVYILESLKTHLKSKNYEAILRFREGSHVESFDNLKDFWAEARIVALCRVGRKSDALALIKEYTSKGKFWNWPIFHLHKAALLAALGDIREARERLEELAHVVEGFVVAEKPNLSKLFFALKVVTLLKSLGEVEAAYHLSQAGHLGATKINDEPLQFDFLINLVYLSAQECERKMWVERLRETAVNTCYNWLHAKVSNVMAASGIEIPATRQTSPTVETLTNRLLTLDVPLCSGS